MKLPFRGATLVVSVAAIACSSNNQNDAASGGTSGGGTGATAGSGNAGGTGGAGAAPSFGAATCMGILECIVACPDGDQTCLDNCLAAGSPDAQNKLVSLANCVAAQNCADVECMGQNCTTELADCIDVTAQGGGQQNPGGSVPPGSVPAELVGQWVSVGSTEWLSYTFGADGSASYSRYKESTIGTCTITADSDWPTGSATVNGDTLTVSLAAGATNVAYAPISCGSAYTNPAQPKLISFKWELDTTANPPWLLLTETPCNSGTDYCSVSLHKQ
ncbi:MAG: hypothetical protein IPM35_32135 [Myxococcales bacterium]|nr:hypothetical protein [Myxococcales bacterium]